MYLYYMQMVNNSRKQLLPTALCRSISGGSHLDLSCRDNITPHATEEMHHWVIQPFPLFYTVNL